MADAFLKLAKISQSMFFSSNLPSLTNMAKIFVSKCLNALYGRLHAASALCHVCVHSSPCIRCFEFLTFTGKEGDRRVYWGNYFHLSLSLWQPDSELFNHILPGIVCWQQHHVWGHGSFDVSGNYPLWRDGVWCLSVSAIPLEWFLAAVRETDWDVCAVSLRLKEFFGEICIQPACISATHNNRFDVKMANNSKTEYRVGWKLCQSLSIRVKWTEN